MNYKIAICDDSVADRKYIADLVKQWTEKSGHSMQMFDFSSAENFLFHYADQKDYDILLLDIEMGQMDGVTMARQIRRDNENVQIVFITGYSEYIAEGYEVAALHYLLKPVNEEKLFAVLDRAVERLHRGERCLTVTLSSEMVRIPLHEIRYLDVQQNYVTIHGKEDYTVKRSLGDFEKLLNEEFFRLGRGGIVNLTYISRVTKTDVYLKDGTVLALPRGRYEALNRAIISYT